MIFHGYKRDLPDQTTLRELHNRRPSNQTWGFFALESPLNSIETRQLNGLFNWTLTYRTDSDVYVPYGFFTQLESEGENASIQDYSIGKDKLVVWTVSQHGQYVHWITFSPAPVTPIEKSRGGGGVVHKKNAPPLPPKLKLHQVHHGDGCLIK